MALLFRVPFLLPIIFALLFTRIGPLLSPETESTSAPHHHYHPSPGSTATVHSHTGASANPSMHQNHRTMEQSQSILALDGLTVEAQASSEDDAIAAAAAASTGAGRHPALLVPPPPLPLNAAPDLEASQAPPRHTTPREQEESASATVAPLLSEPAVATATLLPLHNQGMSAASASSPPPIQAGVAGVVSTDGDERMLHLERVLKALGYNEMASGAALLAKSPHWTPLLERWNGPITIFAAPDVFVQASCSMCSRRFLLLEQISLGYHPFSELVATPTANIPSVFFGLYLNLATKPGSHAIYYARLFVEGVEVSHPEVYNDGRYVVHGIHGIMRPFSHSFGDSRTHHGPGQGGGDDDDDDHHHHHPVPSASTSTSMSAMSVRIRILEAIARLRNRG